MESSKKNLDPLFQIFEHNLVTRSYEDPQEFTKQLAEEYLMYLDSTPAHLPFEAREAALEDIATEAQEMLVKKLYGCVNTEDYLNMGSVITLENEPDLFALPPENKPRRKSR